jgi:hypothetical protein
MAETAVNCPHCGRRAKVVGGLCSSCGVLLDASRAPIGALEPRYVRGTSLWDDVEALAPYALWLVPAVGEIALGLLLSTAWLAIAGLAVLVLPMLIKALFDGLL